jgi:biopolymer transport protein ExbB
MILQITQAVTTPTTEELQFSELIFKGGFVMVPIILLSLVTIYLAVERFLYIRSVTKGRKDLMTHIKRYLLSGDIKGAKAFAAQENSAVGKIIASGLDHVGKPVKEIESMIELSANIEIAEMEKNTGYLGIIAGIAPMLGFVGTISGIIRIFYEISLSDNISIGIIAGGLYEKMITSGSGLIVGVIAYSAYHLINQRISKFSREMQKDVFEFMRSILSPAS